MSTPAQQTLLTQVEARDLTDRIRQTAERLWELLLEAHERQAWRALGYSSWSAYIDGEFSFGPNYAYRLVSQGRVIREIEEVLPDGNTPEITEAQARDIKPHLRVVTDTIRERVAAGEEPTEVVRDVIDSTRRRERDEGAVQYVAAGVDPDLLDDPAADDAPERQTPPARRRALPDRFFDAVYDLGKAAEKVARLTEDDRFPPNAEQVAAKHRSDLLRIDDLLHEVIRLLDRQKGTA